jgi:dolichol-phosphate mannosyltransferase
VAERIEPEISVVLPACDEQATLPLLVADVVEALDTAECSFEVIIVDDGSTDDTWRVIQSMARSDGRVRGIRFSRNFGHQAALLGGLASAHGAAVITMDSDGEHPPELLPDMIERWRAGAAVVQGIRSDYQDRNLAKRATSWSFYRLLGAVSSTKVLPGSADFRLLDRFAVDSIVAIPGNNIFLRGLVPWLGLPTDYVEFAASPRLGGRSKFSITRMTRLSVEGILGFSSIPLRLSSIAGIFASGFAFVFLVYVIAVRFLDGGVVPGWASVAGIVTLLGGLQLLTIGVLGEYVGRLFSDSLGRPPYVVLDTTEPT